MASAMALDAGNFVFCRVFPALQRRKPSADCHSQRLEFEPSMSVWESFNLCKPGLKKILSALAIRSRIMVERRRNLDQALQERFFRIESFEPDLLPMFVGVIKMPGVEGFKAFPKEPIFVVRIHQPSLIANARAVKSTAS
jgi:hypothetical protein